MTILMQFRKYDQQQKTIELTMTKSVTNLTQMTWGVISLWKAYIYVIREPTPVFFGYGGRLVLPKSATAAQGHNENSLFADGEKKSLHFSELYNVNFT